MKMMNNNTLMIIERPKTLSFVYKRLMKVYCAFIATPGWFVSVLSRVTTNGVDVNK